MKTTTWIVAAWTLLSFTGFSFAQGNQSAELSGSAYDYYRLGEVCHSMRRFAYYRAIGESMKERLDRNRSFLQKLYASKESLAAFDALAAIALSMPFATETDFSNWSQADQEKWKKDGWDNQDKLADCLSADVSKNPQSDFFYTLGLESLNMAWTLPMDFSDNGNKVSAVLTSVKGSVGEFVWLRNQKTAESLLPEVADAIKSIAKMKSKIDDPLEGLTNADIADISKNAQSIRDAAKENKLIR